MPLLEPLAVQQIAEFFLTEPVFLVALAVIALLSVGKIVEDLL